MTLIEVILAIAVAGFLLAAATSLLVSISTIWTGREDRHFFEDHVDGVTEFLSAAFLNAGVEISLEDAQSGGRLSNADQDGQTPAGGADPATGMPPQPSLQVGSRGSGRPGAGTGAGGTAASSGLIRSSEEPVAWGRTPGAADYQDPLLNFKLNTIPPLLVGLENSPVLGVNAFLHFSRDEGLSLLWYSRLQEDPDDISDLRRTELSPLVTGIRYIYWDERFENWEEEDAPKSGEGDEEFVLPRFLKLIFEYEGETKERLLTIPIPSQRALIF